MECRRDIQLWPSGHLARGWVGDVMLSVVVTVPAVGILTGTCGTVDSSQYP